MLLLVASLLGLAALATTASAAPVAASGEFIEHEPFFLHERVVGDDLSFTIKRDMAG